MKKQSHLNKTVFPTNKNSNKLAVCRLLQKT